MTQVAVSDIVGPTIGGEGPTGGSPAVFLQVGGCNLSCSWCDTAYTWDWAGTSDMAADRGRPFVPAEEVATAEPSTVARQIAGRLRDSDRLIVSGGEPMLQQDALVEVFHELEGLGWAPPIEVETNGTVVPAARFSVWVDQFNVSPKLAHSGDPAGLRLRPDAIAGYRDTGRAVWKIVAATPQDVSFAVRFARTHGIDLADVWVTPLGRTADELVGRYRAIANAAASAGVRMSARLHVLAGVEKRGT